MSSVARGGREWCRTYLWYEFECDCSVNGDVTTDTKTHERCEDEEGFVVLRTGKSETEDRGEGDSQIESPLSSWSGALAGKEYVKRLRERTNNIYQYTPECRSCASSSQLRQSLSASYKDIEYEPAVRPALKLELISPL